MIFDHIEQAREKTILSRSDKPNELGIKGRWLLAASNRFPSMLELSQETDEHGPIEAGVVLSFIELGQSGLQPSYVH
jgi:hypothetical protein